MANVLVEETSLEDIADAIRSKNGLTTKYKPAEMADAISAISGGGITPTGTKQINITQNGTVTEDVTQYANAQVNVNVPSVSPTGTKQVSITQNGTVTEDVTNYANAEITVNVQSGGGVHTEEGYIELNNVDTNSITVPVDLTGAEGFVLNLYLAETGEVADGVVTKYDHIEIPTAFDGATHACVICYMLVHPQNPKPQIYYDSTHTISNTAADNITYAVSWRNKGANSNHVALDTNMTVASQGVTLATTNATRFFGMTGAYTKFKYEIKWW